MQVLYLFLDALNGVLAFVGQHWVFGLCQNPTYWYTLSKTYKKYNLFNIDSTNSAKPVFKEHC